VPGAVGGRLPGRRPGGHPLTADVAVRSRLVRASLAAGLVLALARGPRAARADDGPGAPPADPQPDEQVSAAAAPPLALDLPPWARSIACPVLYAHEVPSQRGLQQILVGLLNAGYRPTPLRVVDLAMSGLADRPRGCLVLSFDDALYSQYANALPVLAAVRAPAVFFVMPGFADGVHRYMGAAEIRAVHDAGHEVEAHTCNHPSLPPLARRDYAAFTAEFVDCKQMVEAIIGAPVPYLAYPDGTYDRIVLDGVARAGYRAAFTTRPGALLTAASPLTEPRIHYDTTEAPARVLARIHAAGG
jgi:peptidoglycan/xylan/chitin deacetylase (PgdA/CDA1 family)